MNEPARTDILIAGGGLVGASLAVALRDTGLHITVVEPVEPRAESQPSFDDRTTALAAGSRRILQAMGVWDDIALDACAIHHVHVSQQRRLGVTRLSAEEENLPALGYVTPNRALGRGLQRPLAESSNIEFLCPAKVLGVSQFDDHAEVMVDVDGESRMVTASLVVVSDGARSPLREQLGIEARHWDYGQAAIITNIETELPNEGVAYERFTPEGPLALLPLDERRAALVLVEDSAVAEDIFALPDAEFRARVEQRFGKRLGRITRAGKRAMYPLSLVTAKEQRKGRAVILGNAAHSLHPIAGQGFNLSLRDVATLADVIEQYRDDPGSDDALEAYLRWRKSDQRKVVGFTDLLNRLFNIPFGIAAHARGLGLLGLDLVPAMRRGFAEHAMGRAGKLPRLARGIPLSRARSQKEESA
ncbi:MAG: 2-octaprenyl-6-methoxyphenyl hydroxylase [Gammaproteobacteria bacterium]|nr:2-octaprenyl-6-methoxyphenyl hydroxylase [Gammaproteobacteria bacterium]